MNKGKIYYIINNLLDKYDNGEKIEENMFIDALVKIRDIVEENTNKSLLDEITNLQSKIDKAIEYINTIKDNTPNSTRKDFAKTILINYEFLLLILKDNK